MNDPVQYAINRLKEIRAATSPYAIACCDKAYMKACITIRKLEKFQNERYKPGLE